MGSNWGTCIDILAPGTNIESLGISSDTATDTFDGSSQACAHVSGAVAILLALNPTMTPAQITAELLAKAETNVISDITGTIANETVNALLQADCRSVR